MVSSDTMVSVGPAKRTSINCTWNATACCSSKPKGAYGTTDEVLILLVCLSQPDSNSNRLHTGGLTPATPPPPLSDWANFPPGLRPIKKIFWHLRRKSLQAKNFCSVPLTTQGLLGGGVPPPPHPDTPSPHPPGGKLFSRRAGWSPLLLHWPPRLRMALHIL